MAGIVAGLCGLVAAGLALGGSFAPVYEVDREVGDLTVEWWGTGPAGDTVVGLALVLATLLLAAGAVLAFARMVTGARLFLALGLGSLTGTVLLALLNTLEALERWNGEFLGPGESLTFTTSTGLWLPMAGVVVGVVAVVFAHRPQVRVEPMTPRIGFPMPYPRGVAIGQMRPPVAPAPAAPAPAAPAPSASDEEGEITLRTKVTEDEVEAPTEVPDAEAPTQVAHDAPTEIPPPAEPASTLDEPATIADTPATPAPEDWTTRLEEPAEPEQPPTPEPATAEVQPEPTQPEQAPASEQPPTPEQAAAEQPSAPEQPSAAEQPERAQPVQPSAAEQPAAPEQPSAAGQAGPESAAESEPKQSEQAPASEQPPESARPEEPTQPSAAEQPAAPEQQPAPEHGKSSLGDLPAAPPAPELAGDNGDKNDKKD